MHVRWTSEYVIRWTPILTFVKRKLQLLDWFEEHLDPVAFYERGDTFGVALLLPDLRLRVSQRGLRVSTGVEGGTIEGLQEALGGVFEVMGPKEATLQTAYSTWSYGLDDADYHEECASFARSVSGVPAAHEFRPTDASVLADFESAEWQMQSEWGVVSRGELYQRLATPGMGRGRAPDQEHEGYASSLRVRVEDEVPDVSLFVSCSLLRKVGGQVADEVELTAEANAADASALDVVTAVTQNWEKRRTP